MAPIADKKPLVEEPTQPDATIITFNTQPKRTNGKIFIQKRKIQSIHSLTNILKIMKLRTLAIAALAAMTLAACSKDGDGGSAPESGEDGRLGISFKMPAAAGETRAWDDDVNATSDESDLKTVSVYIFKATDGYAVVEGSHSQFTASDFTPNNGVWTLSTSKNIKTVAGNVKIYVAVNVPADKDIAYGSEALMLEAFAELAKLSDASTGFTMFSEPETLTLKSYVDTDPTTIGKAEVSLDRVVSKLVASSQTPTYTQQWTNGVEFVYTMEGLGVYNEAIESYLAKNTTTKSTLNPFAVSVTKNNAAVTNPHPGAETGTAALTGFYICENHEGSGDATYGKTTYAMLATTVTVSHDGAWNTATEEVDYTAVTPYGGGNDDIFIVHYQGADYVTSTKNKAQAIADGLVAKHSLPANSLDDNIYVYTDGWVHFQVYLNHEGVNDYNVGRNEFIHVKVNGVNVSDGHFPGYPGDENDPEKPIDPTDKTDPNNPDPKDPDDNIDPDAASLNVEVTINKWNYKPNNVILE